MGFYKFLFHRILQMIPILFGLSIFIFLLIHLTPGDPVVFFIPESGVSPEVRARIVERLGLDQPLHIQYFRWISRALQGDLGHSFAYGRPVMEVILRRLPATMELQLVSIGLALIIAIPIGIISAVKQYSLLDNAVTSFAFAGLSMPEFWLALMLMLFFSVQLGLLPTTGAGLGQPFLHRLPFFILPTITLTMRTMAWYVRFMRSSMLEVIKKDYINTARAKGLQERVVLFKHAMKNAILPVITIVGLSFRRLLGGAIITESIFAWPGIGRLGYDAVLRRDYPLIMALTILSGLFVLFLNVVVDLIYAFVDPRISYD